MEELQLRPTPLPRLSPTNHHRLETTESIKVKKPVPLPRTTKAMATPSKVVETTDEDIPGSESSSFEEVFTKSYNTLTKSLKKKLKSASGNVHGKSKVVLETTKNLGLRTERSVVGMLQKRQSASSHINTKTDYESAEKSKLNRCQSLPSDNIFSSIKFESPIQQDKVDNFCEPDDNDSLPPPEYPPPPLPDESVYEVLSTRSSHSGSHGDYYTCASAMSSLSDNETDTYLSDLKHLSLCEEGSDSSSSLTADFINNTNLRLNNSSEPAPFQNRDGRAREADRKNDLLRSESWSFYDTVVIPNTAKNEKAIEIVDPKSNICDESQNLKHNLNAKNYVVNIVVGEKIASEPSEINTKSKANDIYVNVKPKTNDQYVNVIRSEPNDQYVNVTIDKKPTITKSRNDGNNLGENEQYVNVSIQTSNSSCSSVAPQIEHKITALKPLHPLRVSDIDEHKISPQNTRQETISSSTGSEGSTVNVPNELYQNWQPSMLSKFQNTKVFNKSYFSEFDPLNENYKNNKKARCNTESLPLFCSEEDQNEFNDFDTVSLPVPPTRFDSINNTDENEDHPEIPNDVEYVLYHRPTKNLPVENQTSSNSMGGDAANDSIKAKGNSPSGSTEKRELSPGKQRSSIVRWTSMKIKKMSEGSHWSPGVSRKTKKNKEEEPVAGEESSDVTERPQINGASGPIHSGYLYRSPSAGEKQKDFVKKHCQLAEGRLTLSSEPNSSSKDIILLEHIYSLQIVRETKQSNAGEDLYCLEISCAVKDKPCWLGWVCTASRRTWMQKLLDSLTSEFPARLTTEFTRAGWCFIKEGISSPWLAAWILLHKRSLYVNPSSGKASEIDLRKARCIVLQESEEGCGRAVEKGPVLRLDGPHCSYYMQMDAGRETKSWCRVVRKAAVDNGPALEDQQLTKDDLPTIIDKCINFTYAHGSMSEGIYRRSGSNSNVSKLLTALLADAWAVQLTRNEYSEHDVASVLKRFFRDLPEPLLTSQLHKVLCNAAVLECSEGERVALYRSQLEKLPPVNYVTTRRLMGHLHHISQNCERNLMPVDNLAAIWGPTLMHVNVTQVGMDVNWSRCESLVVRHLIELYPQLFLVDGAEQAREQRIHEVLERYHNSAQQTPHTAKPSGDIKVWVYIGSRDSDCVSVSVGPQREALDVCNELCPKMNVYGHELCLIESVLAGALIRPLHHTERVLDTVLRWGYWDDADCRDNCLILVINTILRDLAPIAKPPVAQCGELRFADLKSKSFKTFLFEFSQAKLCYYKDKMGSVKLGEWKIEDIVWYIGHEPKRNPRARLAAKLAPQLEEIVTRAITKSPNAVLDRVNELKSVEGNLQDTIYS